MSTLLAKLDSKGRLVIPKSMRERDEFEDGDIFVVDPNSATGTVTFVKLESPLLRQIAESEADYSSGRFQTIEDIAAELDIALNSE